MAQCYQWPKEAEWGCWRGAERPGAFAGGTQRSRLHRRLVMRPEDGRRRRWRPARDFGADRATGAMPVGSESRAAFLEVAWSSDDHRRVVLQVGAARRSLSSPEKKGRRQR